MSGSIPAGSRLAVDVGKVRVGVAASDPARILATPVATVVRDSWTTQPGRKRGGSVQGGERSLPDDVAQVAQEIADRGVTVVYVGLPRHMSGKLGPAAADALAWTRELARALRAAGTDTQLRMLDERLSTVSAQRSLLDSGRSTRSHRSVVDQAAAMVILQQALDTEQRTGKVAGLDWVAVEQDTEQF